MELIGPVSDQVYRATHTYSLQNGETLAVSVPPQIPQDEIDDTVAILQLIIRQIERRKIAPGLDRSFPQAEDYARQLEGPRPAESTEAQ